MAVGEPSPATRAIGAPPFEFATAARIIFGENVSAGLPDLIKPFGRRLFMVTGAQPRRFASLVDSLGRIAETIVPCAISGEPNVGQVDDGARCARAARCDVVVAIGGGSVIDAGKAIAALAANPGEALDYLEVVGRGRSLEIPSLPFVAVPTTAGTGAEVTRNAVLAVPEAQVKASLRSAHMLPRLAVVDPVLTHDLPRETTATTGMDALTQLIEPYLSCRANPLVDALCLDGIRRVARALPLACRDGHDAAARADMALASLFGGLALANAGLGAVHGFAAPLGGMFQAPHGAVCAALLPHVLRANLAALRARASPQVALTRMAELARILTGNSDATADDAVTRCLQLGRELAIPPLATWGVCHGDLAAIATNAAKASSMKANPIALTHDELVTILEAALVGA